MAGVWIGAKALSLWPGIRERRLVFHSSLRGHATAPWRLPSAMPLNVPPPPNSIKVKNAHKAFEEHSRSKTARPISAKWLQSPSLFLSVSFLFLTINIASFFISFLSSYLWDWLWIHNLPAPVSRVLEFTDMYSYACLILPLISPPSFFFFLFLSLILLIETGVHVVQVSLLLCSWCCVT